MELKDKLVALLAVAGTLFATGEIIQRGML